MSDVEIIRDRDPDVSDQQASYMRIRLYAGTPQTEAAWPMISGHPDDVAVALNRRQALIASIKAHVERAQVVLEPSEARLVEIDGHDMIAALLARTDADYWLFEAPERVWVEFTVEIEASESGEPRQLEMVFC